MASWACWPPAPIMVAICLIICCCMPMTPIIIGLPMPPMGICDPALLSSAAP
eukprot:CAMPEP_0113838666 /NCGR_PEP_ID=MMETSP0328-20130328/10665_1 /TAXON_ID=39455 /ORGANISM="Alexandrium minutum" /LENGTH=51 /DNA_ID=CAMNT_0000807223 /DNA_START=8 /DNA_END=159 /DNA_ORIENTATION=- /assembly_acc=CAM_ASM_000350